MLLVKYYAKFYFFFLFLSISWLSCSGQGAVTYTDTPGRLGDKLLVYAKARWVSYVHKIPFFYVPLKEFDNFMMHKTDERYTREKRTLFKKVVHLKKNNKNVIIEPDKEILYVVDYYAHIDIDWNDKDFLTLLKRKIAPIVPVPSINAPEGRVLVAVHVRKGEGFDTPIFSNQGLDDLDIHALQDWEPNEQYKRKYCDCKFPFKFPPDKYYVDQIKSMYHMLSCAPLHVHIFTDARKPSEIVKKYKKALEHLDITFSSRPDDESYKIGVIEGLFGMIQCHCLIRSGSNFSFWADVLGDYGLVFYPVHARWKKWRQGYRLIIDKVECKKNNSFL